MSRLNWMTPQCGNSGPNCPEIAADGQDVYPRNSEKRAAVAMFPAASCELPEQEFRDGEI
ncbi:hypothetical protein ACFQZ8_05985 [Micromonospora azadirachtae]|uniref:DUF397 domain-containing protein n=1 Tax=Micromonospora azadirachtae TaxID=1970735 RepID=A0ABW2ZYK7_9ACTN